MRRALISRHVDSDAAAPWSLGRDAIGVAAPLADYCAGAHATTRPRTWCRTFFAHFRNRPREVHRSPSRRQATTMRDPATAIRALGRSRWARAIALTSG